MELLHIRGQSRSEFCRISIFICLDWKSLKSMHFDQAKQIRVLTSIFKSGNIFVVTQPCSQSTSLFFLKSIWKEGENCDGIVLKNFSIFQEKPNNKKVTNKNYKLIVIYRSGNHRILWKSRHIKIEKDFGLVVESLAAAHVNNVNSTEFFLIFASKEEWDF